jgi:hypothetical protein
MNKRKSKELLGVFQIFHDGAYYLLSDGSKSNKDFGFIILLYLWGGMDALCQTADIDVAEALSLYKKFLISKKGASRKEANGFCDYIIQNESKPVHQDIITKGGEDFRLFMKGVTSAPSRLYKILENTTLQ